MQLIFGSQLETEMKIPRFLFLYLMSGMGGFILSTLGNPNISVGASGSIMGILGGYIAFLIINWTPLAPLGPIR